MNWQLTFNYVLLTYYSLQFLNISKDLVLVDIVLDLLAVDKLFEDIEFLVCECDSLAHSCMVGAPFSDVVLRLSFVPADEIELLCPALCVFGKDTYRLCDIKFEFCHFKITIICREDID